jgi:hypothetical protein
MGEQRWAELMRAIRNAITQCEDSEGEEMEQRVLVRVLAHLWSAHDELELLVPEDEASSAESRLERKA